MEKLMYCHTCYATFDSDQHKPAYVISKDQTKEVVNLCQKCYDRNQAGGKVGRQRVPLDNNVKSFYLSQFSNNLDAMSQQNNQGDLLNARGLPPVYDSNKGGMRGSSDSGRKTPSGKDEVQSNIKNIVGYQKKGLLDILDRETTNYNQVNGTPVNKPPTPLQGARRTNQPPGLNGLKNGPMQNSKISEDTLQESKRAMVTGGRGAGRNPDGSLPSAKKGFSNTQKVITPYPIPNDEMDKLGLKTFASVNEIQRYLDNPTLINLKGQPTKLIDTNNSQNVAGIWRNAYYLSTTIEENTVRKMPAKSMSQLEFPQSFQPLREDLLTSSSPPPAYHVAESYPDKQQSFFGMPGVSQGGYPLNGGHGGNGSRPGSAVTRNTEERAAGGQMSYGGGSNFSGGGGGNPLSKNTQQFKTQLQQQQSAQIQSYLDFNGPIQQQMSQNAGRFVSTRTMSTGVSGAACITNPCPNHYMNEITYLDKTTRVGVCSDCAPQLQEMRHEILPIDQVVEEVRGIMLNLESNMRDLINHRGMLLQDNKNKLNIIYNDQKAFEDETRVKINQLHNYLEDRFHVAINDFQKAILPDVSKVKANLARLEEQLLMNKRFISEVLTAKKEFEMQNIQGLIEKVNNAGTMLTSYNALRSKQNDEFFEAVYPNHLRDLGPIFEINQAKEIEVLANKFRVLTTSFNKDVKSTNLQQNTLGSALQTNPLLNVGSAAGSPARRPGGLGGTGTATSTNASPNPLAEKFGSMMRKKLPIETQTSKLLVQNQGGDDSVAPTYQNQPLQNEFVDIPEMDDSDISNQHNINGMVAAQRSPSILGGIISGAAAGGGNSAIPEPLTNQFNVNNNSLQTNGVVITSTNPMRRARVFDPPGGLRRKIKTVKWLSKKLVEYDIENDFWTPVDVKTDKIYLAFSRTVYLPNQDMLVLGGLDDTVPTKPIFTERAVLVQEVPVNSYDNIYVQSSLSPMVIGRGCFAAIYHDGYVWAFGGVNYTDKVIRKCERYSIDTDTWKRIPDMVTPRKNSSACALSADTIYVFGGTSQVETVDTVEQYSISTNVWTMLRVRLPMPVAFLTTFKVSNSEILIMGGMVKDVKNLTTYKSNEVLVFNVVRGRFNRTKSLDREVLSLYPAFYDDGYIYLVDEETTTGDNPPVIKYDVSGLVK